MDQLDTREWLLTNGLGSFASGTICDARTRTYHGWLVAALDPPNQRRLLLSHIEASIEVQGQNFALGTNFWLGGTVSPKGYHLLSSFQPDPTPTWLWQQGDWQLTRRIVMPSNPVIGNGKALQEEDAKPGATGSSDKALPGTHHRVLIQYTYSGSGAATLRLRPLISDRDYHSPQQQNPDHQFSQLVGTQQLVIQAIRAREPGTLWYLRWSRGRYHPEGTWYWSYHYPEETHRGLSDYEDLYSPGYLVVLLQPGETITLEARVGWPEASLSPLSAGSFDQVLQEEQRQLEQLLSQTEPRQRPIAWPSLLKASNQFLAYRNSTTSPTVMTGYPWLQDWSRYSLIALPGLALTTGRYHLARALLDGLGRYCHQGLIPNVFSVEDKAPHYNSIDTSLWWIETLGLYLKATQDWDFLSQQYSVVKQIYKAFTAGTQYNIRVDASDGLLTWDDPTVALTWMDAIVEGQPVTPRRGKAVEVNALWYSALCWAGRWAEILVEAGTTPNPVSLGNQARRYLEQAEQVKGSLQKFWNSDKNYLYDVIEPDDRYDSAVRPNAVLALSLHHCGFLPEQACQVLQVARDRLLTPYGLRTLDPADLAYIGHYEGDTWHRDLAYHQGSVWPWLLEPFLRSWQRFVGQAYPHNFQPLVEHFQSQACLGTISELFDGDPPHAPRGATAQAAAISALIRFTQP